VKKYQRTLLYLRPRKPGGEDHVVLLDRTETVSPDIVPHVIFNTVFEPRLGKDWTGEEKGGLVHPGQWSFEKVPCATVTMNHEYKDRLTGGKPVLTAHGRAFLKTLYPKDVQTLKIGGPGHYMDDLAGKGSDSANLKAFGNSDLDTQVQLGGSWRFHVLAKTRSARHAVLTAIEATDSKAAAPGTLELLEGEGILGAQAGPNVVLFSKDGGTLTGGSVKVAADGNVRIVVADLDAGAEHTLTAGGKTVRIKASPAGTAFLKEAAVKAGDTISLGR
jgi:hypothetical protein